MKLIRESIFSSAVRSFCIAFFGVIGIVLAVVVIMMSFGAAQNGKSADTSTFDILLPDSNGRKYTPSSHKPLILRIDISGVIGQNGNTAETIRSVLNESHSGLLKGNKIKAILLYINSPGGGAIDSSGIYRALTDYKNQYGIPVHAFVDGLCCSGGMFIACASDRISATTISDIGSVGVFINAFSVYDTMNKLGIQSKTISYGKGKTDVNPLQPMSENNFASYQPLIQNIYDDFVQVVTSNRPRISKEDLINVYGAGVYTAKQSLEYGYIDALTESLGNAYQEVAQAAGIADQSYQVIQMQPKFKMTDLFSVKTPYSLPSLFNRLFGAFTGDPLSREPVWLLDTSR